MDLTRTVALFCSRIATGEVEIYNEFSLQHELGIYLRNTLQAWKVQFERNVSFFDLKRAGFTKREIDISVFNDTERYAIELKYPRNGQHPEQMFSFCKDIVFLEELCEAGFTQCVFLAVADDKLFYEGSTDGIYGFFRGGRQLEGVVEKPTGKKDMRVTLSGSYDVTWNSLLGSTKYTLVEIGT